VNKEVLTTIAEVKQVTSLIDLQRVLNLETLAFDGQGEDIYSLAMIAKVGWILVLLQEDSQAPQGAVELVPTKDHEVGFIHGVVVNPCAQGNGAGAILIANTERIAREAGMRQIDATIAPTNGASLNVFLNKSGYRAVHFYPNFYGDGEHRFWVTRDISQAQAPFDEDNWRDLYQTQAYPSQHLLVPDSDYESLEQLVNEQHYQVIGVIRPSKSGQSQNLLYLVQQPHLEVIPRNE
jgi:ribosomal protein S18 acetylase RimI-like enzyme